MTFGLLSYLGGRVPLTGNLTFVVPGSVESGNLYMSATGGTETTVGNFKIHAFYGPGTFNVASVGIDATYGDKVEYLIIGGGGGGGRDMGGGGGAGAYLACTSYRLVATQYAVTIGAGGAGAVWDGVNPNDYRGANRAGSNGSSTTVSSEYGTLTAIGGGGAGSRHDSTTNYAGNGGSGGGSSAQRGNNALSRYYPLGYPGGSSGGNPNYYSGGGGGAGSRGMNGAETAISAGPGNTNPNAPNGGVGVLNSILGPNYWWAGGGGGGGYSGYGGNGGTGGGGGGGQAQTSSNFGVGGQSAINNGSNGTNGPTSSGNGLSGGNGGTNTGGGGGGTSHLTTGATNAVATVAGAGGSGIVVFKYKYQ